MFRINENFLNLKEGYLFAEVARRRAAYEAAHPGADIISLGIGDVTLPLAPAVVSALAEASAMMGRAETFRGYGDYEGEAFLRGAVARYYNERGVDVGADEIFISDGAKSDIGNILDILGADNAVAIPDPVYPVYVDTNVMAGRRVVFLAANEGNGFLPMPGDGLLADVIYICSPNNPTGAVYNREQLAAWVDYANERGALILFDAAYEAFVRDADLPRSIFEVPGARDCAIEFCSLSKTAGFTGTRCGYTVVPRGLERGGVSLKKLWYRRQSTKYNGTSWIIQRGAAAVFTPEGREQTAANIDYYMGNAAVVADSLRRLGIWFTGGVNSPYIWLKCPGGDSWAFFDRLLAEANVVGTPGAGFGANGEGFLRLTAFGNRENVARAAWRIEKLLGAAA
ncbi:MAG: LL-diaminopimelate aminotransferase [Clostridiales bacterium]|nr:LL-diaminopimelate aminotransferase [Clostridiales bacterium]